MHRKYATAWLSAQDTEDFESKATRWTPESTGENWGETVPYRDSRAGSAFHHIAESIATSILPFIHLGCAGKRGEMLNGIRSMVQSMNATRDFARYPLIMRYLSQNMYYSRSLGHGPSEMGRRWNWRRHRWGGVSAMILIYFNVAVSATWLNWREFGCKWWGSVSCNVATSFSRFWEHWCDPVGLESIIAD